MGPLFEGSNQEKTAFTILEGLYQNNDDLDQLYLDLYP